MPRTSRASAIEPTNYDYRVKLVQVGFVVPVPGLTTSTALGNDDADPATGYVVRVDGEGTVIGWLDERGSPLVGKLNRSSKREPGQTGGLLEPAFIQQPGRGRRPERHNAGQQRRFQGRSRLGRMHRLGQSPGAKTAGSP